LSAELTKMHSFRLFFWPTEMFCIGDETVFACSPSQGKIIKNRLISS